MPSRIIPAHSRRARRISYGQSGHKRKGKQLLMDLLAIPEDRIVVIRDGETLDLGGRSFQFIYFPWVHWPETMLTWLPEQKTLFSCDLFGSHLASADLFATDEAAVLSAAKRYYAEIMMPFKTSIEGKSAP